jgi:hypothetical protein
MSKFEDRLWSELAREQGVRLAGREAPPRHRRSRRAPLAAGGLVTGAIIAAALTLTASSGPQAAYAVSENADGSVTLTLDETFGVFAVNSELARLGVRVRVRRIEPGCTAVGVPDRAHRTQVMRSVQMRKLADGFAHIEWVINPDAIPPGDTLGLSAQRAEGGPIPAAATSMELYRGPAPDCAPTREPPAHRRHETGRLALRRPQQ